MALLTRLAVFAVMILCSTQAFGSVLYSLLPGVTFSEGCIAPCKCPVLGPVEVTGTFMMGEGEPDPLFINYPIEEISWKVSYDGETIHEITGKGKYLIGGEVALVHRLELVISIDGGPEEHLDSDLVLGGFEFPSISIQVSRGTECYDIWMDIKAAPVSLYALEHGSTFSEGCVSPCMCPVWLGDVQGLFSLVPRGSDFLFDCYEIKDIAWVVTGGGQIIHRISGRGIYRIGGEFALMHQMELDLRIDGGEPEHLNSGLIVGGTQFPEKISISVSRDTQCFDIWMDINARFLSLACDEDDSDCPGECQCDFNQDGDVDGSDLALFADRYAIGDIQADLDRSGCLDDNKALAIMAVDFGQTYCLARTF